MTNANFQIGQKVSYTNGNISVYNGEIVKVKLNELVVIDCEAGMILWNAGYSVGSCISFSQVKSINEN